MPGFLFDIFQNFLIAIRVILLVDDDGNGTIRQPKREPTVRRIGKATDAVEIDYIFTPLITNFDPRCCQ